MSRKDKEGYGRDVFYCPKCKELFSPEEIELREETFTLDGRTDTFRYDALCPKCKREINEAAAELDLDTYDKTLLFCEKSECETCKFSSLCEDLFVLFSYMQNKYENYERKRIKELNKSVNGRF